MSPFAALLNGKRSPRSIQGQSEQSLKDLAAQAVLAKSIIHRLDCYFAALHMSASGRLCCKSLFALVIKIFPGCRRDFRVKMWGTSSPDDKLTGDLGNVIESTKIGGRRSDRLVAVKLSPSNFGLLQHGVIPGSSQTKARESALQEPMRPSSCGLAAMESNNGMLRNDAVANRPFTPLGGGSARGTSI
jgi:hypothetical protein